ncbi:uncharacterized protein METZ01_LOCUS238632, partial [marine metagenome]
VIHLPKIVGQEPLWPYTRLPFGGRHPLCGIGVTSLILDTYSPTACNDRIATSLPAPGPLIYTSTFLMPCSIALLAAPSAALCAAKAVPFLDPLKLAVPELPHDITFPCKSVRLIIVLLNVDWMKTFP